MPEFNKKSYCSVRILPAFYKKSRIKRRREPKNRFDGMLKLRKTIKLCEFVSSSFGKFLAKVVRNMQVVQNKTKMAWLKINQAIQTHHNGL